MPLIARLSSSHTITSFRLAAGSRFQEATRLAIAGDRLSAIYLAGYAAEMLLKAAYFRLTGWSSSQAFGKADLNAAQKHAKSMNVVWAGHLHDLTGWSALLIAERHRAGVPYPRSFANALQANSKKIYLNWREFLRYHPNRPFAGEVSTVLQASQWLFGQFRRL